MRGNTASAILSMLKGELGNDMDSTVAPGGDNVLYQQIYNQQNWLATMFDWPFLIIRYDVALQQSVRYYQLPTDGRGNQLFDMSRPKGMRGECYWSNLWNPTDLGISLYDYNVINPDIGMTLVPVKKWTLYQPAARTYAPATAPTAAAGATGLLAGGYQYAVTFVTAYGETDFSPTSTVLTVTSKQVNLTAVPVSSDTAVTSRKIYRTNGTVAGVFYLVATISNNTATTYTDNMADSALPSQAASSANTTQAPGFEVWPVPSDGTMKFRLWGQRTLSPFAQPTDQADLDDMLIMLFSAAQFYSMSNPNKSQAAIAKAKSYLDNIRQGYPVANEMFVLDDESTHGGWRRRDWSKQPTVATMIAAPTH